MVSISVFVGGFLFDLLTLSRIDDLFNLIQQAIYLLILGTLLLCEIKIKTGSLVLSDKGKKFWQYHDLVVHFLFGSLLSLYTIFYYTSASALTSFFFIVLLGGLMLANEFPQIQRLGMPVRVTLFSICVLSYFSFFYPILLGHVGWIPFWLGFFSSLGTLIGIWRLNFKVGPYQELLKKHVLAPILGVHLFFLIGYYFSLIPPVPVAVKKIGVYYDVVKTEDHYNGKHLKPFWKIWDKGSQEFLSRPGDKVFVLISIFSPSNFRDRVNLLWYYDDAKLGWKLEDTIPLTILGGREAGFRGFGSKQFYHEGAWRVIVETSDGREVGRINLTIKHDDSTLVREFKTDTF